MKIEHVLAGFLPDSRGHDGLALAVLLAGQTGARMTVATVQPPPWPSPGPGRADESAWRAYLKEQATTGFDQARQVAGEDADYITRFNRGSGRGLVELARTSDVDVVVIGSGPRGSKGHISLGSTADQLLHASPAPVLLAPKGYAEDPPTGIDRLTVAYRRGPGCDSALSLAVALAATLDVPLRLVTLVVGAGRAKIEQQMLEDLRAQAATDLERAAEGQRREVEVETLEGGNVTTAMGGTEWRQGELIILASSESGPLRRVFLGDTSVKIIRAAPRPVLVLTRQPFGSRQTLTK
ncbi:universal stress protein [Nonomuraea africana]|uniref:Nucleotide-binding universal stress UspA family protein n=1 Tax=Nonomuraea africana TaxID=46171 RepID=A0ABR9KIX3_9ACTN|nr:universal stress protein [Nonomuraea africana]MBE1561492.1 nucleotide-binding universal stress UspA family protein [Nonomuraea africana]